MSTDALQVTTTVATREEAERIAHALVAERLAACAQVQGPIRSVYRWEGAVAEAAEWYCHAKTTLKRVDRVIARIRALHSYVTPEIIAIPVTAGLPEYLEWIAAATTDEP